MAKAIHNYTYNPKDIRPATPAVNQYTYLKSAPLAGTVDTQYAKSLGDYSASWINGAITQILNEQQARLGRFLTYKQKLFNLSSRASSIKSVDSARGMSLLGRTAAAQSNQSLLESRGMDLIIMVSSIKGNPIVKLLTNTDVNQEDLSADLIARGAEIIASLRSAIAQSASLNGELAKHESTVLRLEKDINSIEGELAGRGIFVKAGKGISSLLATPASIIKYAAIAAVAGVGLFYVLPMVTKKK